MTIKLNQFRSFTVPAILKAVEKGPGNLTITPH